MGRIRVLDDALINRIAAGEVVERPASVVKELVENSLDAGARSIEVRLESGGRRLIEITDDGCGMDRDDAILAIERHATSKLRGASGLESIDTLGFRGEALATVAAVSRMRVRTAPEDGAGTEVEIEGGQIRAVREIGLPRGTAIRVAQLFFNVPARRKFLRAESTELTHCVRWLNRYALAHPGRRFRVDHGRRRLLDLPPSDDVEHRVAQLLGADLAARMLRFGSEREGVRISGLAGRPVDSLPRRDAQHFFVNGRAVQDRMLAHAVAQAYGNTMEPGRHPALLVFLEIAPDRVDVNVHPQKTEVRFRDGSRIHDDLRSAVAGALSQAGAVPSLGELRPDTIGAPRAAVREATLRYLARSPASSTRAGSEEAFARDVSPVAATGSGAPGETARDLPDVPAPDASGLRVLGQIRNSYIVAEDDRGLLLVDQHAAHERVLFERFLGQALARKVEMQRLMFPRTVELAPHERLVAESELDALRGLGFDIEPFGETALRLDAIPAVAADVDPETLLRELLGNAGAARSAAADVDRIRARIVTTAACKAAIKIRHPLTEDGIRRLIEDLQRAENPTTCPHGRPILFRLTLEEIERAFRRR